MLTNLHIENYVLIDYLDINFQDGLNIITGETGAGKSILLGAISLLRGARADSSAVSENKNCVIEAIFHCSENSLKSLLESIEIESSDETVIRRVITPSGKSRAYINDFPVQLSELKIISDYLIDIHSQHQTLLLGNNTFQMEVVDCVSSSQDLLSEYTLEYNIYGKLNQELTRLKEETKTSKREEEFIKHQYNQLVEAKLKSGEKETLEEQRDILSNAEQIKESLYGALNLISESDESVLPMLKNASHYLSRISNLSSKNQEICVRIDSVIVELKDIDTELTTLAENINSDPNELERVESRLDLIYSLEQRNHLDSVEALLELQNDLEQKISAIDNSEDDIIKKEKAVEQSYKNAFEIAQKLHSSRAAVLSGIESRVVTQLKDLGMSSARLKIELENTKNLTPTGVNIIRFMFSANEGIAMEKIDKVASGGEMSRLMLTLKSIMAEHKSLPTIIFDEIDTGVSGSVADKMGEIMEQLGQSKQVINITHLPQVASKGKHHFYVSKQTTDSKTKTVITKLTHPQRIEQIASMLSGRGITAAAIEQATELLK